MIDYKAEIAALAARWVVDEGLDYAAAKRRAAKELGLRDKSSLPDNDAVERAVVDYIAIFYATTQPQELLKLRRLALQWMLRLKDFRPHLGGAVWRGSATRRSDIYLQLFCDDAKSVEMMLVDQHVSYLAHSMTGWHGNTVEALSVHAYCAELNQEIGVHLMLYDYDGIRGAIKPDAKGHRPRGDIDAVRQLLSGVA